MADEKYNLDRWRLCLSELVFDVVDRARIKHQAADSLSRLESTAPYTSEVEEDLPTFVVERVQGVIIEGGE